MVKCLFEQKERQKLKEREHFVELEAWQKTLVKRYSYPMGTLQGGSLS